MQFTDAVTVAGKPRRTADGYLVAEARCVRTGIQLYAGDEVGRADLSVVRVYRPETEVFADAALQSFTHAPVTVDHPAEMVTADNWKDLAVGEVSTAAKRDGEWVMLPLILKDAAAIQSVEAGKRELSAGYVCELLWEPGVTADGQAFDAQQKQIRINHLALVDRARAGSQARIGDAWGASPMTEDTQPGLAPNTPEKDAMSDTLKTVVLGDKAVQVAVADVAAIEQFKLDSAKALADANAAHTAAIAAKDTEIGTLKADLKKAQDAALKPSDIDKLVADRATLVTTVKAIDAKIDVAGKTDAELRKAAVAAKLGDEMVKDASEAEIAGMFKALAKDIKPADPFAAAVKDGIQSTGDADKAVTDAYAAMVKDMQSAHQPTKAN